MTYKFLDVIEGIKANLSYKSDKANQELQQIDARQAELKAELAELEPRRLRARSLISRDDLICADCFIIHNRESPLTAIPGDDHVDRFRCRKCNAEYELDF